MTESDFNNVSRTLLNAIRKFYEKEENIKAFEIWQAERQKLQLNNKKLLMNNSFDEQKNVAKIRRQGRRILETVVTKQKRRVR